MRNILKTCLKVGAVGAVSTLAGASAGVTTYMVKGFVDSTTNYGKSGEILSKLPESSELSELSENEKKEISEEFLKRLEDNNNKEKGDDTDARLAAKVVGGMTAAAAAAALLTPSSSASNPTPSYRELGLSGNVQI